MRAWRPRTIRCRTRPAPRRPQQCSWRPHQTLCRRPCTTVSLASRRPPLSPSQVISDSFPPWLQARAATTVLVSAASPDRRVRRPGNDGPRRAVLLPGSCRLGRASIALHKLRTAPLPAANELLRRAHYASAYLFFQTGETWRSSRRCGSSRCCCCILRSGSAVSCGDGIQRAIAARDRDGIQ